MSTLPSFELEPFLSGEIFSQRVGTRSLAYLDHNIWIDLRDCASPEAERCLRASLDAVDRGRVLFPLSVAAVTETLEIDDDACRIRQAELLDKLSHGVCLRPPEFIFKSEAKVAFRAFFCNEPTTVPRHEVYSTVTEFLGTAVLAFPAGWTAENAAKMIELVKNAPQLHSVAFFAEHIKLKQRHAQPLQDYVQGMSRGIAEARQMPAANKQQRFAKLLHGERESLIKRYVLPAFSRLIDETYGTDKVAHAVTLAETMHGDGGPKRIKEIFKVMPAMDVRAHLLAMSLHDDQRIPEPQDFWDMQHACAAPSYSDVFATRDSRLRQLLEKIEPRAQLIGNIEDLTQWVMQQ